MTYNTKLTGEKRQVYLVMLDQPGVDFSPQELAEKTSLDITDVYNTVKVLKRKGLVISQQHGKYRLGKKPDAVILPNQNPVLNNGPNSWTVKLEFEGNNPPRPQETMTLKKELANSEFASVLVPLSMGKDPNPPTPFDTKDLEIKKRVCYLLPDVATIPRLSKCLKDIPPHKIRSVVDDLESQGVLAHIDGKSPKVYEPGPVYSNYMTWLSRSTIRQFAGHLLGAGAQSQGLKVTTHRFAYRFDVLDYPKTQPQPTLVKQFPCGHIYTWWKFTPLGWASPITICLRDYKESTPHLVIYCPAQDWDPDKIPGGQEMLGIALQISQHIQKNWGMVLGLPQPEYKETSNHYGLVVPEYLGDVFSQLGLGDPIEMLTDDPDLGEPVRVWYDESNRSGQPHQEIESNSKAWALGLLKAPIEIETLRAKMMGLDEKVQASLDIINGLSDNVGKVSDGVGVLAERTGGIEKELRALGDVLALIVERLNVPMTPKGLPGPDRMAKTESNSPDINYIQ